MIDHQHLPDWRMSRTMQWCCSPGQIDGPLVDGLARCWLEVANAGGAVGFPFPPVTSAQVSAATKRLVASLEPRGTRLLIAREHTAIIGWLALEQNHSPLTCHWARIFRVQTALSVRGSGVGRALLAEAARAAREDLHLDQLHLELRSGEGLEGFYAACGWEEVGRWPAALRFGPGDDRDEVLMVLRLAPATGP